MPAFDLQFLPASVTVNGTSMLDDNVAFAYTLTGTHDGPFQGHDATGRKIEVRGMQISRFADGLLVERWGSSDELGIMSQLGLA